MMRLALLGIGVLAGLIALDQAVPWILHSDPGVRAVIGEGRDTYRRLFQEQFQALRDTGAARMSRTRRRWEGLSRSGPPDELRVFIIGNSAAIFGLAPALIERRLAEALPDRRVSVVPLTFPQAKVRDELVLVGAAIGKDADVVILTPSLPGLRRGRSIAGRHIEATYGAPRATADRSLADRVRALLVRHWRLYEARDEIRQITLGFVTRVWPLDVLTRAVTQAVDRILDEIAEAAGRGDVAALVATYERHGVQALLRPGRFEPEPPTSPVLATVRSIAREVRDAGVLGIAIFMPVSPLFRDPAATAGFEGLRVDGGRARQLVDATLAVYREAGLVTADRLDALPASCFFDLFHANGEGMRLNSEAVAGIVVDAIARDRRRAERRGRRAAP
jgi:hypothetical protein